MIRRARPLILYYQGNSTIALNYLSKASCAIGSIGIAVLSMLGDWQHKGQVLAQFAAPWSGSVLHELSRLIAASIIVESGTREAEQDRQFETEFVWGAAVGLYHFSIRNTEYMSPVQFSHWMNEHVENTPPVALYVEHKRFERALSLPAPTEDLDTLSVMRRRRSFRGFSDEPIALAQLSDCLFAGLGITGFVRGSFDEDYLPLSMTPSGGGRNPYEAYVYARNVAGLEPGTYHYSAADHSLAPVSDTHWTKPGTVLAGQPWFDNTAALILLVAHFERTMWKYPHPTGYRVVVLEAGHIAQNIILAATAHGLASTPTCAISDVEAEKLTGCASLTRTTMYSVALGHKSSIPTAVDPIQIIPNDAAERHDT